MTWFGTYLIKQCEPVSLTPEEATAVDDFMASGVAESVPPVTPYHVLGGAGIGALTSQLLPKLSIKPPLGAAAGGIAGLLTGRLHDEWRRHALKRKVRHMLEVSRGMYGKTPVTLNVYEEA